MAELREAHKSQVSRFLSFFKGKRERFAEQMHERTRDTKDERLMEDLYNLQDVKEHMDFLAQELLDMSRDELARMTQIGAAHFIEVLRQAESKKVEISCDLSIIEDEKRLLEADGLGSVPLHAAASIKKNVLASLSTVESHDVQTLQLLDDMREENRQLQDRYQQMQKQMTQLLQERTVLAEELATVKTNFKTFKRSSEESEGSNWAAIEAQLRETQQVLARKKEECDVARLDLDKKLNDSTQFRDLKVIVAKKNYQIKDLRARLAEYEPQDDMLEE